MQTDDDLRCYALSFLYWPYPMIGFKFDRLSKSCGAYSSSTSMLAHKLVGISHRSKIQVTVWNDYYH